MSFSTRQIYRMHMHTSYLGRYMNFLGSKVANRGASLWAMQLSFLAGISRHGVAPDGLKYGCLATAHLPPASLAYLRGLPGDFLQRGFHQLLPASLPTLSEMPALRSRELSSTLSFPRTPMIRLPTLHNPPRVLRATCMGNPWMPLSSLILRAAYSLKARSRRMTATLGQTVPTLANLHLLPIWMFPSNVMRTMSLCPGAPTMQSSHW